MRGRIRITPVLLAWVADLVIGVVLSLIDSRALQVIGFIMVIVGIFVVARMGLGRMERGDSPGALKQMGLRKRGPEYIERAAAPPTDFWAREQERFAEHDADRQTDER